MKEYREEHSLKRYGTKFIESLGTIE